jgi:hypothetical protein
MVRETVAVGATAVAEAVGAVVAVAGVAGCVCAQANAAATKKTTARGTFFTRVLDLGEIERFLILLWCGIEGANEKDKKGCDFGNGERKFGSWKRLRD